MACAQLQDSDNGGLECWHAGMIPNDPRFPMAEQRLCCYDLVLDSLTVFEERCNKVQAPNAVGVPALDDPETVRNHAYELAFASEDEMFHSTLYDWLISRNLADDLLEVRISGFSTNNRYLRCFLSFSDEAVIPRSSSQT